MCRCSSECQLADQHMQISSVSGSIRSGRVHVCGDNFLGKEITEKIDLEK